YGYLLIYQLKEALKHALLCFADSKPGVVTEGLLQTFLVRRVRDEHPIPDAMHRT
ncbi:hypothetical protein RB213_004141, partial [Colletotrichum asianum]